MSAFLKERCIVNVTLYGASSDRTGAEYKDRVRELGELIGSHGHTLVYGAGRAGLMAAAAEGVRSAGGRLIGVTTVFMHEFEPPYDGCDELIYCQSMSERKEKLKDMGDAIVAVPGGIGTLDELFSALTERLLRRHDKPIALFDPCGFWDGTVSELHKMYGSGFVAERTFGLFRVCRTPAEVLSYFEEESQAE